MTRLYRLRILLDDNWVGVETGNKHFIHGKVRHWINYHRREHDTGALELRLEVWR